MNPETIAIHVRHYNKLYGLVKNTGAETEPGRQVPLASLTKI